ncbi:UNVERIFIED_CONTAM: hypothetical protein KB574_10885, partial [Streptococcus canis]
FRYPFLSPLPRDSQAWESLVGSPVADAPEDLHLRCTTCPSYPQKAGDPSPTYNTPISYPNFSQIPQNKDATS